MSFLQSIREKVNLAIYDSKEKVLKNLKGLSFVVSLIAVGTLIYYYGFPTTQSTREALLTIIKLSFAFYIIRYLIRLFYTFEMANFLKSTWFEGLLMLLLTADGIGSIFYNTTLEQVLFAKIDVETFTPFYVLFIQLYLLIIVGIELFGGATAITKTKLNPSMLFVLSFLIIITVGCGLLMLPEMTVTKQSLPFLDALFTSISATCVTGLIVVDTATYFSFKGQMIIMFLFQLGGLNIVAFGVFFAFFSRLGLGITQHSSTESFVSGESLRGGLLFKIIFLTFLIELIGVFLIYFSWDADTPFKNTGEKVFFSIFHSISAFNNAGFSIFTNGLYNEYLQHSFMIHIVITILVFTGALGFPAFMNLFGNLRERIKNPWKQLNINTKIALYTSIALVLLGAVFFMFLENDNALQGQNFLQSMVTSIFQSQARTSGFSTVNIGALTTPMLLILIFLMFIGGSSGSTGGGIRTSTFVLLILSAYSTIKGKKHLELAHRSINYELLNKAFTIFLFTILGIFIGTFILTLTDSNISILNLFFEQVSAYCTVGLSTGITSNLSVGGKIVIMLSMFIGRIGTLTIAFALSKKTLTTQYKYPDAHMMVG